MKKWIYELHTTKHGQYMDNKMKIKSELTKSAAALKLFLVNVFGVNPLDVLITLENEYVVLCENTDPFNTFPFTYQYVVKSKFGRFSRLDKWRKCHEPLIAKPILTLR